MLTVEVLGRVQVRRDGVAVPVPAGKTTELLVRLAIQPGSPVSTERLIEDLWADEAPATARNTLQSKASRLRRVLGDPGLLAGDRTGYTLAIDPGRVDAAEALRLAREAARLRAGGDPLGAIDACERGLAVFPRQILAGAGDGAWLAPHRARLEEARLQLTEVHIAAQIDAGVAGELVGELETLVAEHPVREELWRLLVLALYRSGRQSDALTAYRRVRRRLADELGLDPGPQLQELAGQMLQHDPRLTVTRHPTPPTTIRVGNLPVLSASLVGRDADVTAVLAATSTERLVTLVGPAGVGKSRLALEVARRVEPAGGAWLVRLDSAGSPAAVWRSLGESLSVDAATESRVLDRLRGGQALLVLDTCEHVLDVLGEPVARLLDCSPTLRLLATSQVPLAIPGECAYDVAPLDLAQAVDLFTERAEAQRPSSVAAPDAGATVRLVCRALDGLPLAIELAAARARVLPIEEIARRLDDRFALLADPSGRNPVRHRALGAAIAWSYELLFPDDQRGLWALAGFAGGAPLPALEEVLGALGVPRSTALDVVDRLANRSLCEVDTAADGSVRYRLLDSVRAFSLDRLTESGLAGVVHRAHAAWFAEAADRAADGVRGPQQTVHVALARTERANIDAALDWASRHDPPMALRIANGFGWAWVVLGTGLDGADRVRAALDAAGPGISATDRTTALTLIGWFEASGGGLDQAVAAVEEAMGVDDAELAAVARLYLAFVWSQAGRPDDSLALLESCRDDLRRFGRTWEEGASWLLTAWGHTMLGDTRAAQAACQDALRLLEPLGDRWALIHLEALLGGLAQAEGRFDAATEHLQRAADSAHELGFSAAEGHHLANLGRAQHLRGESRLAVGTLERAVATALASGDLRTAALARIRLGLVHHQRGEVSAAREVAQAADRWFTAAGGGDGALLTAYLRAVLAADDGAAGAPALLAEVLQTARQGNDVEVEALVLDALARLGAAAGEPDDDDEV